MSRIRLHRTHGLGLRKAKAVTQKIADELADEYGVSSAWDGHVVAFSGTGVSGQLEVAKDSVALDMKLGLLLLPFKHKIESALEERFETYFGSQA